MQPDEAEAFVLICLALERVGRNAETISKALKLHDRRLLLALQPDKPRQEQLTKSLTNIYLETIRALDALRHFEKRGWTREQTLKILPEEDLEP